MSKNDIIGNGGNGGNGDSDSGDGNSAMVINKVTPIHLPSQQGRHLD